MLLTHLLSIYTAGAEEAVVQCAAKGLHRVAERPCTVHGFLIRIFAVAVAIAVGSAERKLVLWYNSIRYFDYT